MRDTYYSARTGININENKLDLLMLIRLVKNTYQQFSKKGYFQEYFGYNCVDSGNVDGKHGSDIASVIFLKIRKENIWPINNWDGELFGLPEDDVFDMIEFLYDSISKPISGTFHGYNNCGMHYSTFDQDDGQNEYKKEMNLILKDYKDGFELSDEGNIVCLADPGFETLIAANVPSNNPMLHEKINHAIHKFRLQKSSHQDRHDAIRSLADILESLRERAKEVITNKDDGDLFNIANNFAIRHFKAGQKDQYNKPIWYSWMFYFYLATIHAILRFIEIDESKTI